MFCLTRGSIALTIQSRDPLSSFIKRNLPCVIDLSNASESRTVRHTREHRAGQRGNTDLTHGIRRQLRGGGSRVNGGHLWTAMGECNVSLIAIFWSLFNGAITRWSLERCAEALDGCSGQCGDQFKSWTRPIRFCLEQSMSVFYLFYVYYYLRFIFVN